jgi:hypothetical protein
LGAVFQRLSPRVKTGLPFCPEIELDAWEQLHPDELAARVPALSKLLGYARRTGNHCADAKGTNEGQHTSSCDCHN